MTRQTKRLELGPLQETDAVELFPIWNDWDVAKYTYLGRLISLDDCKKKVENILTIWRNPKDIGPYVVRCNSKIIGFIGGVHKSDVLGEFAVFYHFGKVYWGQGYATEAAAELLHQAFAEENTQRVSATAVTINPSSIRVLEKLGMTREGCLRRSFYNGEDFRDLYVYSILRDEYIALSMEVEQE
jgi:[ribosomal protein S5]-alanine N-acetyltransferase